MIIAKGVTIDSEHLLVQLESHIEFPLNNRHIFHTAEYYSHRRMLLAEHAA
jgi:hypothetical protein